MSLSGKHISGYTYSHYMQEFKKVYTSTVALHSREAIFNANLAKIKAHNALYKAGKSTWFAAVNKFTDMSQTEVQKFKGLKKTPASQRSHVTPADLKTTDLPASVDWRTKNVTTPVKDQGGCGSCWTFSTAETLEAHIAIRTGSLMVFSEQQIVSV